MKICVVGWYFWPTFYMALSMVRDKHEPFIVAHKEIPDYLTRYWKLPGIQIPNVGLEFGCYDYYLKNEWDGRSGVLFTHDDNLVKDVMVFDQIAALEDRRVDQAYIFEDEVEGIANGRQHGRAFYCSQKFLVFLLSHICKCKQAEDHYDRHNSDALLPGTGSHTGFWFDPYNQNHTAGRPPKGIRHYNEEIHHFDGTVEQAARKGMKTRFQAYIPGFISGRRARLGCYEGARKILEEKKKGEKS